MWTGSSILTIWFFIAKDDQNRLQKGRESGAALHREVWTPCPHRALSVWGLGVDSADFYPHLQTKSVYLYIDTLYIQYIQRIYIYSVYNIHVYGSRSKWLKTTLVLQEFVIDVHETLSSDMPPPKSDIDTRHCKATWPPKKRQPIVATTEM